MMYYKCFARSAIENMSLHGIHGSERERTHGTDGHTTTIVTVDIGCIEPTAYVAPGAGRLRLRRCPAGETV